MLIEKIISKGVGWKDAGKYFWDVYVADAQGQPSLYFGVEHSYEMAEDRCNRAYIVALNEVASGKCG